MIFRGSSIPLDYIVDKKTWTLLLQLCHQGCSIRCYWRKFHPPYSNSSHHEKNEAREGERVYNLDTTHMIISIGSTSIIRSRTIVFLYINKISCSHIWSSQIIITISWIITGTCKIMMRGVGETNPFLILSYISVISSIHLYIVW